jgi:hypothetical protein
LVTATRAGDATYNPATSTTATETFNPAAKLTQAPVTLANSSATLPANINLTSLAGGGSGTGTFSYTLLTGGTSTSCSLSGSTLSATTSGTCLVTATRAGDATYNPATSTTATETFNPAALVATTTTLTITGASTVYGHESTAVLSATVTGSGSTLPTGTVTFKTGSTVLCTTSTFTTVNSHTISASCSITNMLLVVGSYPVTVTYSGNSHYSTSSSSPTQNLVVAKDSSTTTVAESASSGSLGNENSVVFSATVKSGHGEAVPTGEGVTIHVGTASCPATTNALGVASCSIGASALSAGAGYAVSATYAGDTNISSSTSSNSLSFTVNAKPVFTSASSTTVTEGRSFSFHVTATGYPAPTFSISGHLPGGVTFNAATGVLSGTPNSFTDGSYHFTISASNASGTTTQAFTLTVSGFDFGL